MTPFETWGVKMMSMAVIYHRCPKCRMEFASADLLASHMQKHRFLPQNTRLTASDRELLKLARISPWENEL